jgi:hypothetical protein
MKHKVLLVLIFLLVAGLVTTGNVLATPSEPLRNVGGELFDDWGICRTRAFGEDGFYQITETTFRPVIVFESLGEDAALAYNLGEQLANEYPDQMQRAEAVFYFARDRVNYTPDIDQFGYDEFAQNADELATAIKENGKGYADCEDTAVLLAVMYKGAGYRSAIVVGPGHTAALVYLPDYKKATAVFELNGEPGWVWAEATGRNNPLGWIPKEFVNVELAAYEISQEAIAPLEPSNAPVTATTGATRKSTSFQPFPLISIIGLLWFISLFRRRRAH